MSSTIESSARRGGLTNARKLLYVGKAKALKDAAASQAMFLSWARRYAPRSFPAIIKVLSALEQGQQQLATSAAREVLLNIKRKELEQLIYVVDGKSAEKAVVLLASELWTRKDALVSTRLCSAMMRKLVRWGNFDAMIDLYRQMHVHSIPSDLFTSSVVLLSAARSMRVQEMTEVLEHFRSIPGNKISDQMLAVIINAYVADGQTQEGIKLYLGTDPKEVKRDRLKVLKAISPCIESEDVNNSATLTKRYRNDLDSIGLPLDKLDSIFVALLTLPEVDAMWFLERMIAKHGQGKVVEVCRESKRVEGSVLARVLLKLFRSPSQTIGAQQQSIQAIIHLLSDSKEAKDLMVQALAMCRQHWDLEAYPEIDLLLKSLSNHGLHKEARKLIDNLVDSDKRITRETAQLMLSVYGNEKNTTETYNLLNKLLEKGVDLGTDVMLMLMHRFIDSSDRVLARTMSMLIEERSPGVSQRSAEVFEGKMRLADIYSDLHKVLDLADEAMTGGIHLSDRSLELYWKASSRLTTPVVAIATLRTHGLLNEKNAEELMSCYLRIGNLSAVETLFQLLKTNGLLETERAHDLRIRALASSGSTLDLVGALESMQKKFGTSPAAVVALEKLIEGNCFFDASELYLAMLKVNFQVPIMVYKAFTELAIREKNKEAAYKYSDLFHVAFSHPSKNIDEPHLLAMRVFTVFGDSKKCMREFSQYGLRSNGNMKAEAYEYAYTALGRLGNWLGLNMLREHALHHRVTGTEGYFKAYIRARAELRSDVTLRSLLREMHRDRVRPTEDVILELMKLKVKTGDFGEVTDLLHRMPDLGLKPSIDHYAWTISSLLRSQTLKPAVFRQNTRVALSHFLVFPEERKADLFRRVVRICEEIGEAVTLDMFAERLFSERHVLLDDIEKYKKALAEMRRRETAEIFGSNDSIFFQRPIVRWAPSWKKTE